MSGIHWNLEWNPSRCLYYVVLKEYVALIHVSSIAQISGGKPWCVQQLEKIYPKQHKMLTVSDLINCSLSFTWMMEPPTLPTCLVCEWLVGSPLDDQRKKRELPLLWTEVMKWELVFFLSWNDVICLAGGVQVAWSHLLEIGQTQLGWP